MTYRPTAASNPDFPTDGLYGGKAFIVYPGGRRHSTAKKRLRVCILGNSFTFHPIRPEVKWFRSMGMAASALQNDYVHVLARMIADETQRSIHVKYAAIWAWEKNFAGKTQTDLEALGFTDYRDWKPDVVILRLGENITNADPTMPQLPAAMHQLVDYIAAGRSSVRVLYTGSFYGAQVNEAQQQAAAERDYPFAKLFDLAAEQVHLAADEPHPGVRAHPSDLGMRRIAERIFSAGHMKGMWS